MRGTEGNGAKACFHLHVFVPCVISFCLTQYCVVMAKDYNVCGRVKKQTSVSFPQN